MKRYLGSLILLTIALTAFSQEEKIISFSLPEKYEIGGVEVAGTQYLDKNVLASLSGLRVGDEITIPGDDIPKAVRKLWDQRLFTDISIYITEKTSSAVFLRIDVVERPRMARFRIVGPKSSEREDLKKKLRLRRGIIWTENLEMRSTATIKNYYAEKGFMNPSVSMTTLQDSIIDNSIMVIFKVDRGYRVKIRDVNFKGNVAFGEDPLKKKMKGTREKVRIDYPEVIQVRKHRQKKGMRQSVWRDLTDVSIGRVAKYLGEYMNLNIFKSAKFSKQDFEDDKRNVIAFYNDNGYRDAKIVSDSLYMIGEEDLGVQVTVDEGIQYFIRNITWKGNTKYSDSTLTRLLAIRNGAIYNQSLLDEKLTMSQSGLDISSLYMDDGYLFFNVTPVEVSIEEDSIDLEIQISEGPQATVDRVIISGNTKTNEHVIRRELRVLPGSKFSRSDLIRSQREIANLGYFDPEGIEIVPMPNPEKGTVDIEFKVVEKPSDQLELSAGWGGRGQGVIGTLGISFTNFSLKNMFTKGAWRPLPAGDGQRLSVRVQSNGKQFQSYNFSFTEPWLGGKKPNAFSVSFARSRQNVTDAENTVTGSLISNRLTVALGTRLKWPDDFFTIQPALIVQQYLLDNWPGNQFSFADGRSNNINFQLTIARNSVNQPLFPSSGSNISLTIALTPPYSKLFKGRRDIDYTDPTLADSERFKWLEYHKWRFNAEWYTPVVGKLVFRASAKLGFLGFYNSEVGLSPFERFDLGGDGLSNVDAGFLGRDIVALRGYDVITPSGGAAIFNKFSLELRYPFSTAPTATIYGLLFAEGGNYWNSIQEYNPFDVKRSFGLGLRVFLPMFGLLGFDYGIGFDKSDLEVGTGNSIFKYGKFSIVLGIEPE